jgi:hypothetical protein
MIEVGGVEPATPPRRESAVQTEAYQYLTDVYPERELEVRLNELGGVGWELITAKWEEYSYGGRTHYQARCILKRRVRTEVETIGDIDEFAPTLKVFSST